MLEYFINRKKDVAQIDHICDRLNKIKTQLNKNSVNVVNDYLEAGVIFDEIKTYAISKKDEKLANAQFVFRNYYLLFLQLASYFSLLEEKKYEESWDKLQDCLDSINFIVRFSKNRFELPAIKNMLKQYEMLYPYTVFASSEYVINRSHCSICGQSMNSIKCNHIKGNIYWGEPAVEIVDDIIKLQAVCVVSHPEDKRCILETAENRNKPIEERFKKLELFMNMDFELFRLFSIKEKKEYRKRTDKAAKRNELCPCGSGKKYKNCCGRERFFEHIVYNIIPGEKIEFRFL